MRLRVRVGVFLPGWPRLQMDTIMSKEMISEESGERRDKKEERTRKEEKHRIRTQRKLSWRTVPPLN